MTYHSILRTVERTSLNCASAIRMIERAKECGKQSEDFPAKERKYLKGLEQNGKKAIFYAGYCFILSSDSICITMFSVPRWFGKKNRYCGKNVIRDAKKYSRMWGDDYVSKREIQQYCV